MGTRSLTIVAEGETDVIVMYRQMDGYPSGHGQLLADFLKGKKIVNGIGSETANDDFNGVGCMAASIVAHFKNGIGNFYLYPSGTRDCGEEWLYFVSEKAGKPWIIVTSPYDAGRWEGFAKDFNPEKVLEAVTQVTA